MELTQLYASLRRTLAQLDFNDLFPGFHPYPFALYTDENACLDGQLLPRPQEFYGNTAVLRGGRYIAIWNVDLDPPRDMDRFAAHMVHEMFHCHQFTCGETRFPEDLAILACPISAERFAARHWEYSLLADAFETADPRRLGQFAGLRALRRKMEPEAVVQELKTETAEGMAEFVGLKALHRLSPEQFTRETASYARILRSEDGPLFDSRRMAYYTGALFFLTLERLGRPVVNDFRDPRTAYDQNPVDPEPAPEAVPCPAVAEAYRAFTRYREEELARHMAAAQYVPCSAVITGYDPMNMFRVGDLLFCRHFVRLRENGRDRDVFSPIALRMAVDSPRAVTGYYI